MGSVSPIDSALTVDEALSPSRGWHLRPTLFPIEIDWISTGCIANGWLVSSIRRQRVVVCGSGRGPRSHSAHRARQIRRDRSGRPVEARPASCTYRTAETAKARRTRGRHIKLWVGLGIELITTAAPAHCLPRNLTLRQCLQALQDRRVLMLFRNRPLGRFCTTLEVHPRRNGNPAPRRRSLFVHRSRFRIIAFERVPSV